MKTNPYQASEVRSGLLVTLSAAVLLALMFLSGDSPYLQKTYPLKVSFHFISGLAVNAPVQLAGHEVGKVSSVQLMQDGTARVEVTLAIQEGVKIHEGAQVFIEVMGFMGEKYVEIKQGLPANPVILPYTLLEGFDPIPLMEIVRRGTEMMDEFDKITLSLKELIAGLQTIVKDNNTEVNSIFQNLDQASGNLKDMTHDLKLHPWKLLKKEKDPGSKKRFLII